MHRGFPLYDAHGNNVATLSRSGSGYSVSDRRVYSAWGDVRGGQPLGDPKGRYCASLGHRADDESGFVYMRARYYEPTSGRFISEDRARDMKNWFVYCANNPISFKDYTGKSLGDANDLKNLILEICAAFGITVQTPRLADIVLAYVEKMALCMAIEATGAKLLWVGIIGFEGAGVFISGNPFIAAACGASAAVGGLTVIFANLGAAVATRTLLIELWIYCADEGT